MKLSLGEDEYGEEDGDGEDDAPENNKVSNLFSFFNCLLKHFITS
jgi:hypothetical protein